MGEKRKIYCFNNGGAPGWMHAQALSEDGYFLASHICSAEGFMPHDLGITSDWKHENYNAHFGEGNWELVWVPTDQLRARAHAEMEAAYAKHQELTEADFAAHKEKMEEGIAKYRAAESRSDKRGGPLI